MSIKHLDECFEPASPLNINLDPPPTCGNDDPRFTDNVSFLDGKLNQNEGLGKALLCDPMTTGRITEDPNNPGLERSTIHRYSKGLRATDEAVKNLFENISVIDTNGKELPVPIMWASQERAVANMIQENVRKDGSFVVNRVRIPMMAIYTSQHSMANARYLYHGATDWFRRLTTDGSPGLTFKEKFSRDTAFGYARGIPMDLSYSLTIWTRYWEDMNQILEQIYMKFSGERAYIRIQGVTGYETSVRLDSIANNINTEPGDRAERILKFEIGMTAETFVPQPIKRRKTILQTTLEVLDTIEGDVLETLHDAVEELEA